MLRCDVSTKLLPPKILREGDQVPLTSGPLADFFGTIDRIVQDRRACFPTEILGGQARAAVAPDKLRQV